jgi:putative DNA primase/helicase
LSVVPILPDGKKRPAVKWQEYQRRLPTAAQLHMWFAGGANGIAIICGAVSGGLEVLDFDDAEAFELWSSLVREDHAELLERLPQVRTPAGGTHVYYRCEKIGRNTKLAYPADGVKALVETRGEGGYVLAPGCPGACHPSGGVYRHVAGPKITEMIEVVSCA